MRLMALEEASSIRELEWLVLHAVAGRWAMTSARSV